VWVPLQLTAEERAVALASWQETPQCVAVGRFAAA
jgi:hypothetical protein